MSFGGDESLRPHMHGHDFTHEPFQDEMTSYTWWWCKRAPLTLDVFEVQESDQPMKCWKDSHTFSMAGSNPPACFRRPPPCTVCARTNYPQTPGNSAKSITFRGAVARLRGGAGGGSGWQFIFACLWCFRNWLCAMRRDARVLIWTWF